MMCKFIKSQAMNTQLKKPQRACSYEASGRYFILDRSRMFGGTIIRDDENIIGDFKNA